MKKKATAKKKSTKTQTTKKDALKPVDKLKILELVEKIKPTDQVVLLVSDKNSCGSSFIHGESNIVMGMLMTTSHNLLTGEF